MNRFSNLTDKIIKDALEKIKNEMLSIVKEQVPVDTGDLDRSLQARVVKKDNVFQIQFSYLEYGVFTNLGTPPYFGLTSDKSMFGLPPFKGYRKGIGGIQPQYWKSLRGKSDEFDDKMREAFGLTLRTVMKHIILENGATLT